MHLQAFTQENILKSFEKTRIWPLNPSVIMAQMMEPSTMMSIDINAVIPIILSSLVKKGMALISSIHERECTCCQGSHNDTPITFPLQHFMAAMQEPSVAPVTPWKGYLHPSVYQCHHGSIRSIFCPRMCLYMSVT